MPIPTKAPVYDGMIAPVDSWMTPRPVTIEPGARRELAEEIGLVASGLAPAGEASGIWDGRRDQVHFFELRLDQLPKLQLDNREIIAARLISPEELPGIAVTGPVAVYLRRTIAARPVETPGDPTRSR